jgi:hypothetical protein
LTCSPGRKVLGGGGFPNVVNVDVRLINSYPSADNEWTTTAARTNAGNWAFTAYAICATVN